MGELSREIRAYLASTKPADPDYDLNLLIRAADLIESYDIVVYDMAKELKITQGRITELLAEIAKMREPITDRALLSDIPATTKIVDSILAFEGWGKPPLPDDIAGLSFESQQKGDTD